MAPAYKLTYYESKGAAEPARYLFRYGGINFEDKRLSLSQWKEIKPTIQFGQLPILEHNGKTVNQSIAICRYLGKVVNLTGKNEREDLEIDAIVHTIDDFILKFNKFISAGESEKEAVKEELLKETIPYYFTRFNKIVKKGYFVGGHLTWADIFFIGLLDYVSTHLQTDVLIGYPNLIAVRLNVHGVPAIKTWIDNRPEDKYN